MNRLRLWLLVIIPLSVPAGCTREKQVSDKSLLLWYRQPASAWEEALPVGNGRLGAMIYGNPVTETLQLNEESLWAGSRINNDNPAALEALPSLRKALFSSHYREAYSIAEKDFLGTPPNIRSYQPLGDLTIKYEWPDSVTVYRRELDLHTGIVSTRFIVGGKQYIQEVFASAPDNMIVVRVTSPDGGLINAAFSLSREKDAVATITNNTGLLEGQVIDRDDVKSGPGGAHMKFAGEMRITADRGSIDSAKDYIRVKGAGEIIVRLTAATDYNIDILDFDRSTDPLSECNTILTRSDKMSYDDLVSRHLEGYRKMFDRVSLSIGQDSLSYLPVDERLERVRRGGVDNSLVALYFQYGRYLLISSSKSPGRLPANLQGIWNKDMKAPWNSDFHTNINLQMNYWPAEVCNLPETSLVLAGFLEKLEVPGAVTAGEMYGSNGWTLHHLTDPFGRTGVMDGVWGITPLDGPWMTCSLYEHYLFTGDTAFLRERAYPLMKGAALFILGFLVESPEGYLVTNPSHSPENSFRDPSNGEVSALTYGATTDIEIIREIFDNCIGAASVLDSDKEFAVRLLETEKRLPPVKINSKGVIQEWIKDFDETEPGHRHMSHLLGLYPFQQFTPETPLLYEAARKTIERRLSYGGGHTGWSRAWIINLFARLHDGEKAWDNVQALLRKSTLNNLFDTHPPFQIDGNFGGTAGIAEMLIQSGKGVINLLPAIPLEWSNGEVKGLCARGGFVADIKWEGGRVTTARIFSSKGGTTLVRYNGKEQKISLAPDQSVTLNQ